MHASLDSCFRIQYSWDLKEALPERCEAFAFDKITQNLYKRMKEGGGGGGLSPCRLAGKYSLMMRKMGEAKSGRWDHRLRRAGGGGWLRGDCAPSAISRRSGWKTGRGGSHGFDLWAEITLSYPLFHFSTLYPSPLL